MKGNGVWDVPKPRKAPNDHIWSLGSFRKNRKKNRFFFIFSSSEADFSKEFLTKVLIESTKNFFSKNWSVILKFCFLQIFTMVFAHSELKGFVHWTKIEKQVRFWNYLIFPQKCVSKTLKKLLNSFPTLGNAFQKKTLHFQRDFSIIQSNNVVSEWKQPRVKVCTREF